MIQKQQFNTYKNEVDLNFLREYCIEHGEKRTMKRGETLEKAGEPAKYVAYIEHGFFKYSVRNEESGKDYCGGFALQGECVADFPACLDGDISEVTIEAGTICDVYVIRGQELQNIFDSTPEMMQANTKLLRSLFKMVWSRYLDHFRYSPKERYRRLIDQCPQIVQQLPLKEIASFLNITPQMLSKIRKEISEE